MAEPGQAGVSTGAPFIRIEGVGKRFGSFRAVDDVNLTIERGEIFSLLGGSGCGKTTLLRMLAGFETPSEGRIFIDGQDMAGIPPYERPVNMMFQSYALFPHMTALRNVTVAPTVVKRRPAAEVEAEADAVLAADVPDGEADVAVLEGLDVEAERGHGGQVLAELEVVEDGGFAGGIEANHEDARLGGPEERVI